MSLYPLQVHPDQQNMPLYPLQEHAQSLDGQSVEAGGRRLAQELGVTVPGKSQSKNCQRFNCFPCNSGNEGVCRKTGAGYQIDCNICGEQGLTNTYAGETGKNLFNRGANHINDVEKKRTNSPLWKHIVEKHNGAMTVPIFAHFQMKLIQFFSKPQRRKANEGVRIANLDPDIRIFLLLTFINRG